VAVIGASFHAGEQSEWRAPGRRRPGLRREPATLKLKNAADLDATLTAIANGNVDAIHAFPDGVTAASRVRIAEFALSHHLPSIFGWRAHVESAV
jgi:putative tryptophan/tyrosine transport system substrate-binding protein